ncbi:MAG: hypothetical protein COB77_01630 [Gammaproteobacteria bacterium]|nr:MAG: hypothetical protein COB77_01630 [Gammaproteobacteria bacterium]
MTYIRLFTFIFTSVVYVACASASETIYPVVTYKCDVEADIVTLTNSLLKGDEGATFNYSDTDGTYSPWNLLDIDRSTSRTRIVKTRKIKKTCKLSSGEYTVTIEPEVFNRNLSGTCDASISSAFTVTHNSVTIKELTPFEDDCRSHSPIITRVTVFGKTSEVKIKRIARSKFY